MIFSEVVVRVKIFDHESKLRGVNIESEDFDFLTMMISKLSLRWSLKMS